MKFSQYLRKKKLLGQKLLIKINGCINNNIKNVPNNNNKLMKILLNFKLKKNSKKKRSILVNKKNKKLSKLNVNFYLFFY